MKNKVDFDEYIENYDELLGEQTSFFSSDEHYFARYKVDALSHFVKQSPETILEFGCGIGRNIGALQKKYPVSSISGSDIARQSIQYAQKVYPEVEFFLEPLEGAEAVSKKYDLIMVAGVFHHIAIPERQEIATDLVERLNPNGNLFVFEHNPYNPVTRRIVSNCKYDEDAVLLYPNELKKLFQNSNANVVSKTYCLFIPPKLTYLLKIEKWLGWLPLGGQYFFHITR